jgi:amidase
MRPLAFIVLFVLVTVVTTRLPALHASARQAAETHRLLPVAFFNTFSVAHTPVLRIKSGDRVATAVVDDISVDARGQTVARGPNPQIGPFFVEGAEPGDLLVMTIETLEPNRDTGTSAAMIAASAVEPGNLSTRGATDRVPWTIDAARRVVRFDLQAVGRTSWRTRFDAPTFEMPLAPSLASVAVAPAGPDVVPTTMSGPFGGNMSAAGIAAGARVMLPVFQPGALLFLGHGHARQGDGGVTGTGVETSLDVEFRVDVVKKREWPHSSVARASTVVGEFEMTWPRIESTDYLMTVGSGTTLQQALQHATLELHHWLDDDFGLSERAVNIFVGQALEYEVATVAEVHGHRRREGEESVSAATDHHAIANASPQISLIPSHLTSTLSLHVDAAPRRDRDEDMVFLGDQRVTPHIAALALRLLLRRAHATTKSR